MCGGGGGSPAKAAQPFKSDPDVIAMYNRMFKGVPGEGKWVTPTPNPNATPFQKNTQSIFNKAAGGDGTPSTEPYWSNGLSVQPTHTSSGDDYADWDAAYYMYQKEESEKVQAEQKATQQSYYDQQNKMAQEQMALQKQLQQEQIASQERLDASQKEMQAQQDAAMASLEKQRVQAERDSAIASADAKRELSVTKDAAAKQDAFNIGRDKKDRKNAGGAMASRGTKALQIGLSTGGSSAKTAGLAIPT